MLLSSFVVLTLAVPHSVALTPLNAAASERADADFASELLAQGLEHRGLKVMTPRAIAAVLGNERQKQLLGCSETCVTELAGALGVDALLVGDLAKLGTDWAVTVRLVAAQSGETIASSNERATTREGLPLVLDHLAWAVTTQLGRAGWELRPGEEPRAPRFSRAWAVVPGVVGLAGLGLGIAEELMADTQLKRVATAPNATAVNSFVTTGKSNELLGTIAISVGVAGLLAAVVVFFLGDAGPGVTPVAWVSPSGSGLGFAGVWP
jgi:hypothetical protein